MASDLVNIRKSFVARPGYLFLDPDFSQIEPRMGAAMAGERPLLEGFVTGKDFYSIIYSLMAKIPFEQVTKKLRQIGKVTALGQAYGQGVSAAARQFKMPYEEAEALLESYWNGLPATRAARDELIIKARREGAVRTIFGNRMPLPDLMDRDHVIRAKAERQCWNFLIQGQSAIWLKIAMLRVDRALVGRDAHILLTVHDELLIEVSQRERLAEIIWLIRDAMEFHVKDLPIDAPMYPSNRSFYPDGFFVPIDMQLGMNWGEVHDLEDKTTKDKLTGESKTIKGFKSIARDLKLDLDWETFDQPVPDYVTPRRNRYKTKSSTVQAQTPQGPDMSARFAEARQKPVPETKPSELKKEARVDPFRYPCVVVTFPQINELEEQYLAGACRVAGGQEHLFLNFGEDMVDANQQVDAKMLLELLSKMPRIGATITSERYCAAGRIVRKVF